MCTRHSVFFFFFQAEDGIRDIGVTGVQTCALPISGSATQKKFNGWLDRLVSFVGGLKDDKGQPIPIIFRPFHEHTQSWSWWGNQCTTEQEFISLWRYTVDYLRRAGVHQFIYALSRSEEHTSELQSRQYLVCRLLLE